MLYWFYCKNNKCIAVQQGNIHVDIPNHCFVILHLHITKYCRIKCLVSATYLHTLFIEQPVLATGAGDRAAVQVSTGETVQFSSRLVDNLELHCVGVVVTRTRHRTVGFRLGWNWTTVPTLHFIQLWLHSNFWVLIVSWHDEYADCAVLRALSPPAFRICDHTDIRWVAVK